MGNNKDMPTEVAIQDEAGQEIMKAQAEDLQREIDLFKKNLTDLDKTEANFKEQFDIDVEINSIIMDGDNMKPLVPKTKFEESERFWELQKIKHGFTIRQQNHLGTQQLEGYKVQRVAMEEQLASATQKLEEMTKND